MDNQESLFQKPGFKKLLFFGFIFDFVLIDQLVKWLIRVNFKPGESPGFPWPGVFEITLSYNQGIAWGMFQGSGVIFVPVALGITFYSIYYLFKNPQKSAYFHITLGLLSAGAIGNMIDRLFMGKVTDMFWFRLISFPVFNIADACITVAGFMLVIYTIFLEKSHSETIVDHKKSESSNES